MAFNPKNKAIYLARLKVRSDAVEGGSIPDDEMQCDFVITNGEVDGHGSIMTEKTMRNYTEDCIGSVPFMLNHSNDMQMQIGQTIAATYDESLKQVVATVRILRDTEDTPENLRVNEYIRRMERGMYNSVSVGFRDAKETCNLPDCGKDIFDWMRQDPCPHIPKQYYNGVQCTYDVDDAHLREVSLVPAGSNPNAKLLDTREWVDDLSKIKQAGNAGNGSNGGGENEPKSVLERDGLKYREGIIKEAIGAGIRAKDNFDEEKWRKRFETMEAEQILEQKADWDSIGDSRWGTGGRATVAGGSAPVSDNSLIYPNWVLE